MKGLDFPIVKSKTSQVTDVFDLNNPEERKKYFEAKAGEEIQKLRNYFENNSFIAYMLAKKAAGKGTYSKMFREIIGTDKVVHISIGDVVRDIHKSLETEEGKKDLMDYLHENYRGFISVEDAVDAIMNRSTTKVSVPNELMMTLIKREIDQHPGKTLFIDGFPRTLDQISYSLYFSAIMDHREDPDLFVLIDVPEQVIDERLKYRVVCPNCQTPRNTKLLATPYVGFDEESNEFYLMCDNPECNKERMVTKEGDELGIEAIRDRIETDDELIRKAFGLHGVPKAFLRNSVPVNIAEDMVDEYEITPGYRYERDEATGKIKTIEEKWAVTDDNDIESYSLLPAPVVLTMIKQLVEILEL